MNIIRRTEHKRIAYYRQTASAAYWDEHWRSIAQPQFYHSAEQGILVKPWFRWEEVIDRYLPKEGRILEAGCGLGQVVVALRARGYDVEGVEWAEETVSAAKALQPDLPICTGDVTKLDVPDGYYQGYISLGVVEHRREGPEPFLKEAVRVLAPKGFAFISVPYMHPLRKLKAMLGLYRGNAESLEFYQYIYHEKEICSYLEAAGLRIIDRAVYDGYKGLKDELPLLRKLLELPRIGAKLRRRLMNSRFLEARFGHMIMLVAQKP